MANLRKKAPWASGDGEVTPERTFISRRAVLRSLGYVGAGLLGASWLLNRPGEPGLWPYLRFWRKPLGPECLSDAPFTPGIVNPAYTVDAPVTPAEIAASYNNFYEFTTRKDAVWRVAETLEPHPWQVEVKGLVDRPGTYDLADLLRGLDVEERTYRFRCVEAWSMVVPWTGVPLAALLRRLAPQSGARFVRFVSRYDEAMFPGQTQLSWHPWPYFEALSLAEALSPLTLLATGVYGRALPKQHGAPIRLIVPWKYGFKSIKSIARIELVAQRPPTFWTAAAPQDYSFLANVDPTVPHPSWSQQSERDIATGERRPTLPFNGYGEWVAHLYG